jgi:hypothetical protein
MKQQHKLKAFPQTPSHQEVVVIVHAGLTTTSEQSDLSVITNATRMLITSETSNREQTDCACVFKFNCFNPPATLVEEGAKQLTISSSFELSLPP